MNSPARTSTESGVFDAVTRRTYLLCALAIALLSSLINFSGINGSEVIDDHDLLHNPIARGCGRNPLDCFRHPQFGLYYRPLMGASFSLGEDMHGQSPRPFHIENVFLHAVVVLEACWAFRLVLRRDRAALFAGLLYAVHPLQVPVTTFIGGRTDTLAMVFLFCFVIATVKSATGRLYKGWRAISVMAFAATIFTKEQCLPLVFLVPLLASQIAPRDDIRPWYRRALHPWMLWYVVPVVGLLLAAHRVIPANAIDTVGWRPTSTRVAWDLALRIEMVGRTLAFYAKSFIWPTPGTLHQSSLGAWDTPQPFTALGGFFAAGLWIAVIRHVWPCRRLRVLALWTCLTVAPCLNILPIPSQFVACYRAAIPLFGAAGLAGALLEGLISTRSRSPHAYLSLALPAAAAFTLALLSIDDVGMWRSDAVLTMAEFRADPNFLPALAGFASAQRRDGFRKEALTTNDRIMARLFPTQHTLEARAAVIDTPWMLRHVKSQSSLRYQPRPFVNYVMRERGGGAQELGLYLEAIDNYRLALAMEPDDYEVGDALVYCFEVSGRYEAARAALERLIARAPTSARLHRLGLDDMHLGRWSDARQALARSLSYGVREHSRNMPAILRLYEKADEAARHEQEHGKRTGGP